MKRILVFIMGVIFPFLPALAQSRYYENSQVWLQKAEESKPVLVYKNHYPVRIVKSIKDEKAYQGWRMEDVGNVSCLFNESLKKHSRSEERRVGKEC